MLQAINLTKKYGDQTALDGLNLEVQAGEIYCLLGANGAGKTTTLNLFLDFIRPTSGQARIAGQPVGSDRNLTAYIPELVSLYGNLSGRENLAYFSELAGKQLAAHEQLELLQEAGLDPAFADKPVSGYSKGMRQKVAVAAAVARQAQVMLLDEPTSGLDPKAANELSKILLALKDKGTTVLMATHDIFRAREIGTRLGIMKSGRLVAQLEPSEISPEKLEAVYMEHMHD